MEDTRNLPNQREVGSYAYEFELPWTIRIHPVFNISPLDSAAENPVLEQLTHPLPTVEIDAEEKLFFEEILDSHVYQRMLQYLVKWTK